jgi:coenzyme F420-0:L-glutamate ligase/coenzyme F420-1:gamma-L-glutamate ligase
MPSQPVFSTSSISIIPLLKLSIIQKGDNVGKQIVDACHQTKLKLADGDLLVVAQTIVSRAEGRIINLSNIVPSSKAKKLAKKLGKPPELVEIILKESKRIVRAEQGHLIVETHHGFVCANAGVDASNVPGKDFVTLLPKDPDYSAKQIRNEILAAFNVDVAVIISDTHGRPFRNGAINIAIGTSGLAPIKNYVGQSDLFGYQLRTTSVAVADELASAAELLMGEADEGIAVVIIRGYPYQQSEASAQELVRDPDRDIFRR